MPDLGMWRWTANCKPSVERSILEGNLGVYLKDACNVIEALERENAAMAKVLRQIVDQYADMADGDIRDHWAKMALAALAPATSKETPPIFSDNCQHKWEPAERHMEVGPGGWFCTKCKGICNL